MRQRLSLLRFVVGSALVAFGVLAAVGAVQAPRAGAARAPASQPLRLCTVTTDKTATPVSVLLGSEVEIALSVSATCPELPVPGKADIVLAIDRSASQRDNGTWAPTMAAASAFVDRIDFARHQVAVLTFSGGIWPLDPWTELHQPLTSDAAAVKAALAAVPEPLETTGGTNLTAAVEAAQDELMSPRHRSDAQPVIVLLSDGGHNIPEWLSGSPTDAAQAAKDAGTLIVTIGLGVDQAATQTLTDMASRPSLYFPAPTADQLDGIMRELAGTVGGTGWPTQLEITDMIPSELAYVDGSAVPAPSESRQGLLVWRLTELPREGWSARYRVRPLVTGTYATNKLAYVDYLDGDGSVGTRDFPQPVVTVLDRGENGIFLPVAHKGYCRPAKPYDLVLVLDTSSSMWGAPLDRTRQAAGEFLAYLDMPRSRAAVVAFNVTATVVQPLTSDRATALAALDRLPLEEGSRIDLAVLAGVGLLSPVAGDPGRIPVMVLITDGVQVGGTRQDALDAGAAARQAGIMVYTIGFGSEGDPDLLLRMAGSPDRFFDAPGVDDLPRVFRAIAGALPCAPEP